MFIMADATIEVQHGDFGEPGTDGFYVPECHAERLQKYGINTVEGLYSLATQDPAGVAKIYGWTVDDVETATTELREELEKSNPKFLEVELSPKSAFGLGYLHPNDDKQRR